MAESLDMDALADDELQARIDRGDFVGDELEEMTDNMDSTTEEDPDEDEEDAGDEVDEETDEDDDDEDQEGEDEDEDPEEDEGESESEEVEDEEGDDDIMIPKHRLDEVIGQRNSLKEQIDAQQAQIDKLLDIAGGAQQASAPKQEAPKAPSYDFAAAQEKLNEAILSDDKMTASKLYQEMENARDAITEWKVEQASKKSVAEAAELARAEMEQLKMEALVETYETEYPFLQKGGPEENADAIEMVNMMMNGMIAQGKAGSTALRQAVKKVAPLYKQSAQAPVTKQSKRKKAAVKKNVAAAKKQAPKGRSSRVAKEQVLNPATASRRQWSKVSEREKAIMRGDIIE